MKRLIAAVVEIRRIRVKSMKDDLRKRKGTGCELEAEAAAAGSRG
jgi:hypothetical protein